MRSGEDTDIVDRADCERLVRAFYGQALTDPIIGFLFVDVAKLDLESHIPEVTSFWETVLLGAKTYGGGAFHPHVAIHTQVPLTSGHFQRWLALWTAAVDGQFAGPRAEEAKTHAQRVAHAFHRRLQGFTDHVVPLTPGGGLTIQHHGPPSGDDRTA